MNTWSDTPRTDARCERCSREITLTTFGWVHVRPAQNDTHAAAPVRRELVGAGAR